MFISIVKICSVTLLLKIIHSRLLQQSLRESITKRASIKFDYCQIWDPN